MLKRICDRCGAEIPMEQTMDDNELILRKINNKPFDLCPVCQNELRTWFDRAGMPFESVVECRDCLHYNPKDIACRVLKINVAPDFWCKCGHKVDYMDLHDFHEVKDAGTDMVGSARGAGKRYAGFNEEDADDTSHDHAE